MYKIKKLTNRGNPDFRQDPDQMLYGTCELKDVEANTVEELKYKVAAYIDQNELGGGNFMSPTVYENNEPIGYFSYNLKFWETEDIPWYCV